MPTTQYRLRPLLVIACIAHLVLFAYDIAQNFAPFLQGDRSYGRMEALQAVLNAPGGNTLSIMAFGNVIPSEYLFQLPFYWVGGAAGVILFQVILAVLSVLCIGKLAGHMFSWRHASFVAGAAYLLLPQNLVFAHQFVTEAIATPCMVFFFYFFVKHLNEKKKSHVITAALFLGLAIFVRPSLALVLPALLVLFAFYRVLPLRNIAVLCAVAMLPLAVWMALFTATTDKIGYTNGVANLGWNLRSKVFLVDQANGFEKHAEVQSIDEYADLYHTSDGITVSRFLEIVAEHPIAYVKVAVTDAAIVFGKGNATKLLVDYFSIARDSGIKGWRDVWEREGADGLMRWASGNVPMLIVFACEILWSLVTITLSMACIVFVATLLLCKQKRDRLTPAELSFVLAMVALLLTILASAEMVDRAQARLRHPAEAGMILLAGLALRNKRLTA